MPLDMSANLIAVLSWHVYIGQNDVRLNLIKLANRRIAVVDGHDIKTRVRKSLIDESLNGRAVIGQQDGLTHYEFPAQSLFGFESIVNVPSLMTDAAPVSGGTAGWLLKTPTVFPNMLLSGCIEERWSAAGFGGGTGKLSSMSRAVA